MSYLMIYNEMQSCSQMIPISAQCCISYRNQSFDLLFQYEMQNYAEMCEIVDSITRSTNQIS